MKGQKLYKKALKVMPGGTQLFSKRPEMFLPDLWPAYYKKAKGVEVTDLDGKKYIDMSIFGVGACVLGYADAEVNKAVKNAVDNGSASTLNCPEEVELAEMLCKLHPWADMARFCRGGGEAVSIAVRIARAYSGKDKIAFCGYHGWCDWYLAANLSGKKALDGSLMPGLPPGGVPRGLRNTVFPFNYGNTEELENIVKKHGKELGIIIMEPARGMPDKSFLKKVRRIADKTRAILIFDEITTGFRMTCGGIHLLLGVNPDMAVFAKSMGNGYPIGAIIGKRKVMQAAQKTFISSTNWTERTGPAAAIATIKKYKKNKVEKHIIKIGNMFMKGLENVAKETGLKIHVSGISTLCHFSFDYKNELAITTYFTQEMLKKGFLAWVQFKPSYAHKKQHIDKYLRAAKDVFVKIKKAVDGEKVESQLECPVALRGFHRFVKN
ncbi:MAG: aminotransferase class III-fold pyridoxal phosphate-dependent enzyme [bacterium]